MTASKNLYVPFRALGLVCDGLEATGCSPYIYKRGLSVTITTPVDGARALHCYNMNLRLRAVSRPLPAGWVDDGAQITACLVLDDITYAAYGKNIVLYDKMRPYTVWGVHEDPVSHALILGHILVTVSARERRVLAFRLPEYYKDKPSKAAEVVADVTLPVDFEVSAICHPQTYVNKVLLGSRDGRCILLNLRSRSIIHSFPSFGAGVTVLSPTPALDVVAVGLADGRVVLHNFKYDETIATYQHGSGDEFDELDDRTDDGEERNNPIRAITFRTDKTETMVVSDKRGNLVLWDLNEKRMLSAALRVHRGGAALAQFLEGEPILVTAGLADNSIKVHIFDGSEGEARMLRSREGHKLPPTCVRFCGRSTNMFVSVGLDRELRLVSSVQDNKNKTFSQASLSKISAKKRKRIRASRGVEVGAKDSNVAGLLPIVTALATSTSKLRDEEYANIITAHANREQVYTWRSRNASVFQHVLKPGPRPGKLKLMLDVLREGKNKNKKEKLTKKQVDTENRTACAVTISPCGNFGIVGSMDGRVHVYNLQSGTHVGAFEDVGEDTEEKKKTEKWGYAHEGPISEVAVDALSDVLLTVGRMDKKVKYWKLRTRERILNDDGEVKGARTIETPSEIVSMRLCKCSDLVAVVCENFTLYVYDGQSGKLAREFAGHQGPITDVCFTGDGRRLVSSSMDGTLRTWDLVSGTCIDVLHCSAPPTSVVVAARGAFLATTHVNNLAVVLWIDQSKYIPLDEVKKRDELPTLERVVIDGDEASDTDVEMEDEEGDEEDVVNTTCLEPGLVTFSGKPASQWTVLSNLHAIRERNKPLAPPKKPANVPFFLPTKKGLTLEFDVEAAIEGDKEEDADADDIILDNSQFGKLVSGEHYEEATKLLDALQPSDVDVELRTIEGKKAMHGAANYFLDRLRMSENFELTQARLGVFLDANGMELAKMDGGGDVLEQLATAQEEAWTTLRKRFEAVVSLGSHFAGQV